MADHGAFDRFIDRWRRNEGGAERANFPLFLTELCALLDLPQPDPADATHEHNDYVFERDVATVDDDGKVNHRRIDLYRRGCFVLEAKQSRQKGGAKEVALTPELDLGLEAARGRRSAHRGWDVLMRNARVQAEQYARALPASHGWPPFILVCDVGHVIEVFADFSGQGKNYRQFPDRESFRIYLDDLKRPEAQARLRAIWHEPHALDPARHSAAVTRNIAERLAKVSQSLEKRDHPAERVAHFLMRCLFTMFAEDVGLIDKGSFADVLNDARANPDSFGPMVQDLWATMDKGGFSPVLRRNVRRFNGGLFADRTAIPLAREEIGELYEAARHDWRDVEPAIFGTLLEQALDTAERKRLGAHYTPRPYVERLVLATVIEPLRAEWEGPVLGTVERERATDPQAAIRAVHDFHVKLAGTRVLDPACGTGNFLYVALELMKQLEGEVLEVLADLGGQEALQMETMSVHPKNFLGLELNPRAAAIAELVLWLGYLQWQIRNGGAIKDPVLERLDNIQAMDAVLAHDPERPKPDGSGTELPNPRRPEWPEADYIVGNPPFIGKGAAMRDALGDGYVEALRKANPKVPYSADLVMYWWDRAAQILTAKESSLKRFGLVTTNSIGQVLSRQVVERHLRYRAPLSLVLAIPDHPWTKATPDAAAVRIAMTVAVSGRVEGELKVVRAESGLETDQPQIAFTSQQGQINADLTLGASAGDCPELLANSGLSYNGMMLAARGFILSANEARHYRELADAEAAALIRPYVGGADLVQRSRSNFVIDTAGLSSDELRRGYPHLCQHLLTTVKLERASKRDDAFRENWWLFGRTRPELREALVKIPRYIGTTETAKHRVFQFLDSRVVPDHMVIAVALAEAWQLGVLSSKPHLAFASAAGGTLEDRPRYTKSRIFDPFPFPDPTPDQRARIGALADELDATRKEVLADHHDLTLTTLYNLREKLARGDTVNLVEQEQRMRGRVDIIRELHDRLDAAVTEAYGWPAELSDEAIVARLVGLNAERRAEEKAGRVRWLRSDYQIARAGITQLGAGEREQQIEAVLPEAIAKKPNFPRDAIGQTAAVLSALRGGGVRGAEDIARGYAQGRRIVPKVTATLQALTRLGYVSAEAGGYRLRKAA